jgi:di/tricarboxylate transporter
MEEDKVEFGKREIGFVAGILAAIIIWNLNLEGISVEGQKCLALSLMTVVFWATQIAHPGFVSGIYLISLVLFDVAPATSIFALWTQDTIYLIIGAYLIAGAVQSSGLGERIAYKLILRNVRDWQSFILTIFVLTFILSVFIPHPWPRSLMIMSVVAVVFKSAKLIKEDAAKIGFVVFACSVPISLILLTGDSVINIMVVEFSGVELSWLGWFMHMGVPSIIASIITYFLILILFKQEGEFNIDLEEIKNKLAELGPMSRTEKKVFVWIILAIILWMTDSIHGIALGWVTLLIAMAMALPVIGDILTPKDWEEVPVHVLLFLTASISIGRIGGLTGMNGWIATFLLPSSMPANPVLLGLIIAVIGVSLHMILGSVIAVMGVAIPALLTITANTDINPLVPTLFGYAAIAMHYIFPFHHLNILIGLDEGG